MWNQKTEVTTDFMELNNFGNEIRKLDETDKLLERLKLTQK